jgi:phosphatidylserine decarboxylase
MRIHKEGYTILLFSLIFVTIVNALIYWFLPILLPVTLLGAVVLLGLELNFFRNPIRHIPNENPNLIYSPADGKVVVIEEVVDEEYAQQRCLQISIFMSIYDVHANRSPITGKVTYFKYHPGKYLLARHPKSSTENERNTFVFEHEKGSILVRQIAGAVARRIRSYVGLQDSVVQGQEIGFIKFGSRADILLPLDAKIQVKFGQKVKAGLDVIAVW